MGHFGATLARSWYMADDLPSYYDLDAQLEWLLLLLSDQNRVRAAGLHAAYYQCRSQITNDNPVPQTLEHQHYNIQCSVTPIHRLPGEIMMEIFHIALDVGQLRGGLMEVCKRWCNVIEGMASVWASLKLGAGATPERMQLLLSRAGTHPLTVKIDIEKETIMDERLQTSLAMLGDKASQWQTITITSLPQDEPDAESNHALLPIQLQPMRQLRHLNIIEPVLSPLLRSLLQNVATTAIGNLTSMKIHSFSTLQYFLQPGHSSLYCFLTTFIARVPKMAQAVDILPHFMQLEVLELTNLILPIVGNGSPLPLAHTLHHLYLKSVSIQWMGERVFSRLENCTIIAPLTYPSLEHDVQLPACTRLHFENWNISPIKQFLAPALDYMTVNSNAWSPYKGDGQVVQLVRAGFGTVLQPKSLSLGVICTDKVLLAVLRLLPELVELRLDLPRPSALGKHFFTELLAKPGDYVVDKVTFDWNELFRKDRTGWRCTICPYLRILKLTYHKWVRPTDNDDFLPLLRALRWSREKTATPLQLHVHYKSPMHSWQSLTTLLPAQWDALKSQLFNTTGIEEGKNHAGQSILTDWVEQSLDGRFWTCKVPVGGSDGRPCDAGFSRMDRAIVHIRGKHLDMRPYLCENGGYCKVPNWLAPFFSPVVWDELLMINCTHSFPARSLSPPKRTGQNIGTQRSLHALNGVSLLNSLP